MAGMAASDDAVTERAGTLRGEAVARRHEARARGWRHAVLFLVIVGALACATGPDRGDPVEPPAAPLRTMSATINGVPWTATAVVVAFDTSAIRITATRGRVGPSLETLEVQFRRRGVGVQILDGIVFAGNDGYGRVANQFINLWQTGYGGGAGTLTVTLLTPTRAVGTFAFTAGALSPPGSTDLSRVTNGAFDVTF